MQVTLPFFSIQALSLGLAALAITIDAKLYDLILKTINLKNHGISKCDKHVLFVKINMFMLVAFGYEHAVCHVINSHNSRSAL